MSDKKTTTKRASNKEEKEGSSSRKWLSIAAIVIAILYAVGTSVYVGVDIVNDFKDEKLEEEYDKGRVDTIKALINQSKQCQPFSVFDENEEVNLINIECLESSEPEDQAEPPQ